MINRKTAYREAQKFAAALEGPLGRRRMQAVVRNHIVLFERLRESGASWTQVAALLTAAGVRDCSGAPVSANAWRAMVSRTVREASRAIQSGEVTPRNPPSSLPRVLPIVPTALSASSRQTIQAGPKRSRLDDIRSRIGRTASLRGANMDRGAS